MRYGAKISNPDGMPRGSGVSDPVFAASLRLGKIDSRIKAAEKRERETREKIERWCDALLFGAGRRCTQLSKIIDLRFLQGMPVPDASFELFGDSVNYDTHEESYIRKTFRRIDEAVALIAEYEK